MSEGPDTEKILRHSELRDDQSEWQMIITWSLGEDFGFYTRAIGKQ